MKRLLALALLLTLALPAFAQAPQLTDKDKVELAMALSALNAARADLADTEKAAEKAIKERRDFAIKKRDEAQALINKAKKDGFVLNLDKLVYEAEKPKAAAK